MAAILGLSRWQSQYACWVEMSGSAPGRDPSASQSDVFRVGHAFERALAYLWKEDNPGWRLSNDGMQMTTEEFGFPAVCTLDRLASRGRARRIVEMKTARDLSEWGDEGGDEAPNDYLIQVQAQQLLTGLTKYPAHLVVMGPFFKHFTYTVEFDQKIADWMVAKAQEFYASLSSGTPPPLDDTVSTYNAVRAQHPGIVEGMQVEVPESLYMDLSAATAESKAADTKLRGLKTKLLDVVGDAQCATVNGEVVATRRPSSKGSVALFVK
jgi:predicted phage-related endonuclease